VAASVRAASKLRIAALRLAKARRSYRSSAAISRALSSKIAASLCSAPRALGDVISSVSLKSTPKSASLCQEHSLQLANPNRLVVGVLDLADEHLSTIGQIAAKALAVLGALLWGFHNATSGFCFHRYERIAEAARCAVSSVGEAINALEARRPHDVGQSAQARPRAFADHLGADGWRWRVMRTSNPYEFRDPGRPARSF
jgi:hypothetical protein